MANDYLAPPPQGMFDPTPMAPPSSLAPAGASSLAPGAPGPEQQALADRRRYTAMLDQEIAAAQRNINASGQTSHDKAAALQPLRDQQLQEAMRPIPEPPKARPTPQAPDPNATSGGQEWLTAAMFLGALAGALTRRPVTNALAGFTGAVQGWEQGKQDQFEKSMKQFEAESKAAAQANKESNDEYMRVLKSRELSMEQKSLAIQIVAAKYDDQAAAQLAEAKQHEALGTLIDQRIRYGDQLAKSTKEAQIEMWTKAGEAYAQSAEGQARVKNILAGREKPPPPNSRTTALGYRDQAISDEVRRINPNFNFATYDINSGAMKAAARAEATIDPMVVRRTETAFAAGPEARSVRSLNVAVDHLSFLDEKLIPALKNGDINVINSYKNYFQRELGAQAPANFEAARQIIGQEIVKAVVNNGGGVTERQEAQRFIDAARSADQLHGVVKVYERLMAGQLHGLQEQYEAGGGRKDFNKTFLRPETRTAMDRVMAGDDASVPPNEMSEHVQRLAERMQAAAGQTVNQAGATIEGSPVNKFGQTKQQMEQSGGMLGEFKQWLNSVGGSITPISPQ